MVWSLWAACTREDPRGPRAAPTEETAVPPAETGTTPATSTADTGDSAPATTPTGTADPCATLSDVPLSVSQFPIETTEDFDFDGLGRLVWADWSGNLVGTDGTSRPAVISPGSWDTDARGIQVLSDGTIAVNYIGGGRIVRVDPVSGAREDLLVGLGGPNALEVGADDVLYFTETYPGRVSRHDLATGVTTELARGFTYPNGLALSQDQRSLYVSDDARGIFVMSWDDTLEAWSEPVRVFDPAPGEAYDAMETDVCGNLYSVQFYSGKLYRYTPATGAAVLIQDMRDPNGFLWNAIRWGSDRGVWRRDTLYVTSRSTVFAVELGVRGRDQPVDSLP